MTIKVHLPCRARGQERVQRCGYAAFCLNSQKGEQQDRRGDYPVYRPTRALATSIAIVGKP